MKTKINMDTWSRRPQFDHFIKMDEPFYGVCVQIDCTKAYEMSKQKEISFFVYYLYYSLQAANTVEAFRYRIEEDGIYLYDELIAGITVDRYDNTFGFGYLNFHSDLNEFASEAKIEIDKIRAEKTLNPSKINNLIHYSVIPWVNFTSLSHPRRFSNADSCPKITFGKMITDSSGRLQMPVSIHVHHALAFGRDIGMFIDCYQKLMNR